MLHAKLRAATGPYHTRLDAGMARLLFGPDLTRPSYSGLLHRLHAFVSGWEDRAAYATADALPGLVDSRRKAGLLRDDLRAFDKPIDPVDCVPGEQLPALWSVAAALGSMYVMEGATLGGRVIAPRVRKQLGLTDDAGGTAYFESYGPAVNARWREFLSTLETAVPVDSHDAAVKAACDTFAAMERWLLAPARPTKNSTDAMGVHDSSMLS